MCLRTLWTPCILRAHWFLHIFEKNRVSERVLGCFLLLSVTVLVRNPGYNGHNVLLWHPWRHIRIRRGEGDRNYFPECQLWLSDGQPGLDLRGSEGAYTVCQPQPEQSWHFQGTTWLLQVGISSPPQPPYSWHLMGIRSLFTTKY